MDRITESLLSEFVEQNGLALLPQETAFEHFTGYLVTSKHHTENFATDDIHVGAGNDCGIDSIGIIVNGSLITEPDEIEDLADTNGYLDVTFVFNQAERSSSFDTSKVGQFGFGIQDFFSKAPTLRQNEMIQKKIRIVNEILSRSSRFKKGNPQCFTYYTTTGKWTGDTNLEARKRALVTDLQGLNLFRKVEFEFIDAEAVQALFRESKNAISKEINFPQRTVLPEVLGIEQAYIGILSSTEYLKLIENTNEEIITSIFYDNVRHWQDWNDVNMEMKATLESETQKVYFPLLNNGVTIIARTIIPTANRFVVEDYQIVNGCQTSYVIHECRTHLNDQVFVPIRLIATGDSNIKNAITKATNRQTEVSEEQLFALADFPKKLEDYFPTFDGNKKLYYERRSRQFNSEEGIEKVRIINMTTLVRAYASMFLGLPHRTTRDYRALLRSVGTGEIFNKEHRLEMYYVSAYAHYKLEYLFRSSVISSSLKLARYQLIYLFRLVAVNKALPRANSHDMSRYCSELMNILWDETQVRQKFQLAADIITQLLTTSSEPARDFVRTEPFTLLVQQKAREYLLSLASSPIDSSVQIIQNVEEIIPTITIEPSQKNQQPTEVKEGIKGDSQVQLF